MKSIMQTKDGRCYLCMKLHDDYSTKPVHEHHVVFGTANRRLSEKYGLKTYLCISAHHEYGPESVHNNAEIRKNMCADAQRAFEKEYPGQSFREIFGRNYIFED